MTARPTLLGQILATCAEEAGSLDRLSEEIGVSRQALASILAGRRPSLATLRAVVAFLGVSADDTLAMMDAPDEPTAWAPDRTRGGRARMAGLSAAQRSDLARHAARSRHARRETR